MPKRNPKQKSRHGRNHEQEDEHSGEDFRRELERRINRFRAQERADLDAMKRRDPAGWQAAFDAAVEQAIAEARAGTIAFWTGDPHLFEEDPEICD